MLDSILSFITQAQDMMVLLHPGERCRSSTHQQQQHRVLLRLQSVAKDFDSKKRFLISILKAMLDKGAVPHLQDIFVRLDFNSIH